MIRPITWLFLAAILLSTQVISAELSVPIHRSLEAYEEETKVDQLLLLIQKRLAIMHEVARTKWNQDLAIEDKEREQQILTSLIKQSKDSGLDEIWLSQFFQAQMEAAKEVQKTDFAIWQKQNVQEFPSVLTLAQLRTYIDEMNREIIDLLSKISDPSHTSFILDRPISIRSSDQIESSVWDTAISPLK